MLCIFLYALIVKWTVPMHFPLFPAAAFLFTTSATHIITWCPLPKALLTGKMKWKFCVFSEMENRHAFRVFIIWVMIVLFNISFVLFLRYVYLHDQFWLNLFRFHPWMSVYQFCHYKEFQIQSRYVSYNPEGQMEERISGLHLLFLWIIIAYND